MAKTLEDYKSYMKKRLAPVSEIIANIAAGDFTKKLKITDKEDEFTELYVGMNFMMEDLLEHLTERQRSEDAMKISEENYRNLVDNALIGVYKTNLKGEILYVNESLAEMFEFESSEDMKTSSVSFRYKNSKDRDRLIKDLKKKKKIDNFEIEAITKNDKIRHVLISATLEGETISGMIRDITERKRAVEAYQTLVDQSIQGLVIVQGEKPEIQFVNSALAEFLGYTKEEIMKLTPDEFSKIIHPDDVVGFFKRYKARINNEPLEPYYVLRAYHKDGSVHWLEFFTNKIEYQGKPAVQVAAMDITERKKAEEALIESEEKYRLLFENAAEGIISIDVEGIIIDVNPRLLEITGFKKDEMVGKDFVNLLDLFKLDFDTVTEVFDDIISEKMDSSNEWDIFNKNGEKLIINTAPSLIKRGDKVIGVSISVEDITKRKQAEEQVKKSEELYRSTINGMNDFVHVVDKNLKIVLFNNTIKQFCEKIGIEDELIGKDVIEIFSFLPEQTKKEYEKVLKNMVSVVTEESMTINDDEIWTETRKIPIFNEYREIDRIITIVHDITKNKLAEKALKESEEKYRTLFESAPEFIGIIGLDGTIIDCNDTQLKALGLPQRDVIGKSFMELGLLNENDTNKYMDDLIRLINGEEIESVIIETRSADNEKCWIEAFTGALRKDGEIYAIQVIARDITDRKNAEDEIKKLNEELEQRVRDRTIELKQAYEEMKTLQDQVYQAQKMESIGILAGGIAHDFNNALTAILGNISLAKLSSDPNNKTTKLLNESERACLRARDLTQQLLTFSKGGAPIKKTTSIGELIKESAAFVSRGSNVKCDFSFSEDLFPVEIDIGQINQVINNLIINAEQAMPQGGVINVKAENINIGMDDGEILLSFKPGKYVKITIIDKGIGIPQEHLQKIFDPYFSTKQKGSGLGLATSYSIIKNHNGYITVDSKLGSGTTFNIYLPASDQEIIKEQELEKQFIPTTGKILIMDDEEIILDLVGEILNRFGYDSVFAKDGTEAIDIYERSLDSDKGIDAVIMDLTIPGGMGGKETIQKLLEIDPKIKAIVSSGYSNDPIMNDYQEYGFSGVIAKPYKIEELGRIVQDVLSTKKRDSS